jgi:anaerobic magnesium-protoporphyrin IX monomethyl ester cyclase
MKFLFVIPKNNFAFFGYRGISPSFPHLGVAYLIAALQREGIEVKLFDDSSGKTEEDLFDLIATFKPDLIGLTLFTLSRPFAYPLISKIKEMTRIPVVIGGAHVSTIKTEALSETKADFAIKYEGEYPLLELVREIQNSGSDFSEIKNLIWRDGGRIIENPDRAYLTDLDSLPFPQFDLYDIKPHPAYGEKIVPLITSRGCPFRCNFCSVKLYMGRGFRKRSPENVFREIKYQYEKGYRQFDFNDDCFTLDKKRSEAVLDLIINSGLKIRFQFYNGLRVDTVDPGILKKLKQAGCFYISYGCESGNEEILKNIQKAVTLQEVRQATAWTKAAGIACSVNFIIGHKGETYQTAMDSVRFARSIPVNFVNFYNLIPYPGTEAFEWAKEHGHFLVDTNNYLEVISYADNKPIFETPELSKEQREHIVRKGFSIHEYMVLRYRFGAALGWVLFILTRNKYIKIVAARFATMTNLGNKLAIFLSKKSYEKLNRGKKWKKQVFRCQ